VILLSLASIPRNLPLVEIDIGLLAGDVCQPSTHTSDLGEGEHDFDLFRREKKNELNDSKKKGG
jgi:hypothetical protein